MIESLLDDGISLADLDDKPPGFFDSGLLEFDPGSPKRSFGDGRRR
jgi:hypothetical protein